MARGYSGYHISDEAYAELKALAKSTPYGGYARTVNRFLSQRYASFTRLTLPPEYREFYDARRLAKLPVTSRQLVLYPRRARIMKVGDNAFAHYLALSHIFNIVPERRTDTARVSLILELIGYGWIS